MNSVRLLAITPGWRNQALRPWLWAMADHGLQAVVIREPHLTEVDLRALVEDTEARIPHVWVHDANPHARALERPLHLKEAGQIGRFKHPWARSCHSVVSCRRAMDDGAAYALLSPIWVPTSKPGDKRRPLGIECLNDAPARTFALGGVTAARLADIIGRGHQGGAVLGGLFGCKTPAEAGRACENYRRAFTVS